MKAMLAAFVAAVLVQPIVFMLRVGVMFIPALMTGPSGSVNHLNGLGVVILYVMVVAAGFVLVLGVPLFLLLGRFNRLGWAAMAGAGFGAGAIPLALFSWPLWHDLSGSSSGGNWHGQYVDFIVNGVHTIYGWLSYVEGTLWFGLHGLVGAVVFYGVWLRLSGRRRQASPSNPQ